jgi:VCBS repeat-containing protein
MAKRKKGELFMAKWLKTLLKIMVFTVISMALSSQTDAMAFSSGESAQAGSGQVSTEEPLHLECTSGVADADVTVDGRPLLWKLRNESNETNDLHYFASGVQHYSGLGPATYSFLGMGPANDSPEGPVRQGLNSQGLAVGFNVYDESGWELLHQKALGFYNTVSQVRTYVNQMTTLSTNNYFIDTLGEAAVWENQTGTGQHWEYNTRAPARDNQWIDVDNADYDNDYTTGTDVSLSGWVVRANDAAFHNDGTDNLAEGDRYRVGRDVVGSLIYNNGKGTALSAKSVATSFFRNNTLAMEDTVSNMIVQGVLPTEDRRLSTMWVMLGHSETGIFVPVWIHGVESGGANRVPQYLDVGEDGKSVYTPARGMYDKGFNQANVQARTLPFEGHLFDVVNSTLLPDWRSRNWTNAAVATRIGEEMKRVQEKMDADAYGHLKYLYDNGATSNFAPLVSIDSVSTNDLQATFSVMTDDADGNTVTYQFNFGDGQTGSGNTHTYAQAGHYLVSCTVTDSHGVSQTDWIFITVIHVNKAPTNISLAPTSTAENQLVDTVVGTFDTTDPDVGDTYTYTLVSGVDSTDNASFNIISNSLRTSAVFDYETKNNYKVRIRTTDQGGLYFEKAFTITVTNVNDAPVITEGTSTSVSMDEDGSPTAFTLTLHATDSEEDTRTWSISSPASHGTASATGTGASKAIGYTSTVNFNGTDSFTVQVSDGHGGTDAITVSVTIAPQNDAPVCLAAILGTSVDTAGDTAPICTDVDAGDTLTYSIVDQGLIGTASVVTDLLHYMPTAGTSGTDTFTYKANDIQVDSNIATVTVSIYAVTQSISLYRGWNLVSFYVQPTNTSVAAVLASINNQYTLVYAWDATSGWLVYDPSSSSGNTLNNLDEKMGFWIKMITDKTLVVGGSAPNATSINLKIGWNLVGYPSEVNGTLPDIFTGHGVGDTTYSLVYTYHADEPSLTRWKLFDPTEGTDTLTELVPGWGYWIKASAETTWIVP